MSSEVVQEESYTGFPTARMGMLIFLISESMMFVTLISGYLVLRASQAAWPPANQPHLNVLLTGINTFFLMSSSVTFHFAEVFFRKSQKGKFLGWLGFTILLGATFLTIQAFEYSRLMAGTLSLSSSTYGSVFFSLTGFHGLHVLIGLLLLSLLFWRMAFNRLSKANHHLLDNIGLYWHFVDGVWIVLFSVLYLW
jgi:cytochrome c oxidase subunit III